MNLEPSPSRCVLSLLDPGPMWVMASLRTGCLPLGIETGLEAEGLPSVCNSRHVEDRSIICCKLNEIRYIMFNDIALVNYAFMHLSLFDEFLYIL